jgi:2-C-methyl-D-erythritol 2,4-cyclodiphosphate synthase
MLCGIQVPHSCGVIAHSDGDVAIHALVDAILGTLALGDIGTFFPPSDDKWRNADSAIFLQFAHEQVNLRRGRIVNADILIICEKPKIVPHQAAMRDKLAQILDIGTARINVKATTTEKLGFLGRQEGIAVQAAISIELPRNHMS